MARVVALYRYPLKGFTPQSCDQLVVLPSSRVAGDRVLNVRFADAPVADDAWCRKYHGVVLANTPGLALLATAFDVERLRLKIALGDRILVDEPLSDAGRARIVRALTDYVAGLDENPLEDHPERLPLKLVGDGATPRYQDSADGQVTLHSRATLTAVFPPRLWASRRPSPVMHRSAPASRSRRRVASMTICAPLRNAAQSLGIEFRPE